MPFADFMPTIVFPDTRKGRGEWQAWDKSEVTVPYFCDLYRFDQYAKGLCARRDPSGNRHKNLCFRCVAGYVYDAHFAFDHGHIEDGHLHDRARIEAL